MTAHPAQQPGQRLEQRRPSEGGITRRGGVERPTPARWRSRPDIVVPDPATSSWRSTEKAKGLDSPGLPWTRSGGASGDSGSQIVKKWLVDGRRLELPTSALRTPPNPSERQHLRGLSPGPSLGRSTDRLHRRPVGRRRGVGVALELPEGGPAAYLLDDSERVARLDHP